VERLWRGLKWKEVANTANKINGYNWLNIDDKVIKRHRIIASCFLGLNIEDPAQTVDHINRDKLDNRVENLRIVTQQQQTFNRGAKGYCWHKQLNKWQSAIALDGKSIYLGLYVTEDEARQAYLDAKAKYHII
jgi:hypothetical protein